MRLNYLPTDLNSYKLSKRYLCRCGPCKMIAPHMEEMSKTMDDVVFLKVSRIESDSLAISFSIHLFIPISILYLYCYHIFTFSICYLYWRNIFCSSSHLFSYLSCLVAIVFSIDIVIVFSLVRLMLTSART